MNANSIFTDFVLDIQAINPFTGTALPVVVSTTTEFEEFSEAHLAIPDILDSDKSQAETLGIAVPSILTEDGDRLINSGQFSGLNRKDALKEITACAKERHLGGYMCSSKLKDWLISRQRYWGTPIPMIHCPKCKTVPVATEDLPVELPILPKVTEKGVSPLSQASHWYNVSCPKCGGPATRETDTMDTFVDSSWYFFRYLDPHNDTVPFTREKADRFMPVDLYIGGKEHAVLHLYFARFFSHFLYNLGYLSTREPFINLLTQGMVLGQTYSIDGRYLTKGSVDFTGPTPVEKSTGKTVLVDWDKMSKSKFNGVDPQEIIEEYGVDTTRLCILSNVAPVSPRKWSYEVFIGVLAWQRRVWDTVNSFTDGRSRGLPVQCDQHKFQEYEDMIYDFRNKGLVNITDQLNQRFMINAAISRLHEYMTNLKKIPADVLANSLQAELALADLLIMLSPMAPAFSSELWTALATEASRTTHHKWDLDVLDQAWPLPDLQFPLSLECWVNKDLRFDLKLPRKELEALSKDETVAMVTNSMKFKQFLEKAPIVTGVTDVPGCKKVVTFSAMSSAVTRKQKKKNLKKIKLQKKENDMQQTTKH